LLLFYFTAWRLFSGIVGVCTGLFLSLYTLERYGFNETALRSDFSKEQCMCEVIMTLNTRRREVSSPRHGENRASKSSSKPSPCAKVCHAGFS
jgi:hypothetical protein